MKKVTMEDSSRPRDLKNSIAKSLFLGNILEENLFPFPEMSADEQETVRMIVDSIDKFMGEKEAAFKEYDERGEQPQEYISALKELGLFGLIIDEEYGGLGISSSAYSRVIEQVSRYDASTSITIGAHCSIGLKGLLLFGTPEQKKRYLPRLATGDMIAAFCLTEPGSGSDAASVKTHAKKNEDGSWVLNGDKIWISNGAFADFFTVFARTDSEEGKISAFIVERDFGGLTSGPKEDKLGIRASATTTITFDNTPVPAENLLGEEGKGFKIAMAILNSGRTGLGGGCVGGMKQCLELASKQARDRKQFGKSISEFGLIKEKLGQMTVDTYAAECMVKLLGHLIDSNVEDYSLEAAICKVYCSEALWRSVNEATQVAGGNGFMKEFPYERLLRDSRINMIFEGTNEILRLYIALSGMRVAGECLRDVGKGLGNIFNEPIKGFGTLSTYATRRFTHLTSFGKDRLEGVDSTLQDLVRVYENGTLELSRATDVLLRRHKKDIIGKQFAMKRIADVVVDLIVGLAVLSRVTKAIQEKGADKCQEEIQIATVFSRQANRRMTANFKAIDRNEDENLKNLSDFAVSNEGYVWD